MAVEESRLGIPILFAYDTIHGYRTIFPIPLGAGEQLRPGRRRRGPRSARARRPRSASSRSTARWSTSRTSRAGAASPRARGEDPYLNSVFAAARVKAAQGRDYAADDKVVTSLKHFAAYGQPEGGRDYNTTDMSEQRLRNLYLPPFKAAIDAGADTVMCSFNAINGVPGCANDYLETDILKGEWGFDGFIESDYTAVAELRACPPTTRTRARAATASPPTARTPAPQALNAGTDSEMVSTLHPRLRRAAARRAARSRCARINDAVRRILRIKFRAGLFENPYVDPAKAEAAQLLPEAVAAARKAAAARWCCSRTRATPCRSTPAKKTAVIGPLGDNASTTCSARGGAAATTRTP